MTNLRALSRMCRRLEERERSGDELVEGIAYV